MKIVITDAQLEELVFGIGAIGVQLLGPAECERLNVLCSQIALQPVARYQGDQVEQNFEATKIPVGAKGFDHLVYWLQHQLEGRVGTYLPDMLEFTDWHLQRYLPTPDADYGISPHRDNKSFIGLVVVILVQGEPLFHVCSDKQGSDSVLINAQPGDAIIMRGTGFDNKDERPIHYVGKVTKPRLTFSLRQQAIK
ncbi:MAG: hypothetical protein KBB55_01565 [Candidatus Buchananbacteria bacterium]|nr:hypothetical protein [Candidatus Buchananbacteria bacterium]